MSRLLLLLMITATSASADALIKLCKWLDHHNSVPVNFDISRSASGSLLVEIEFKHENQAKLFQREFRR